MPCRLRPDILAAVKLVIVGPAEAHLLQDQAQLHQYCKQLQDQVLPEVLAAGSNKRWDSISPCNMSAACGCFLKLFVSQVSSTACCQGLAWSGVLKVYSVLIVYSDTRERETSCVY